MIFCGEVVNVNNNILSFLEIYMTKHVPTKTLFESAHDSVRFAHSCLEQIENNLRAKSSFVDPQGNIMHWHDFGDLEGPGWAANAVGGAHLLYRWGIFLSDETLQQAALKLLDHVLEDGFIQPDGFIWPYYELAQNRFCLNYTHNNDWLCPGSLAKIGVQMLEFASDLNDPALASRLQQHADTLSVWLEAHIPLLPCHL